MRILIALFLIASTQLSAGFGNLVDLEWKKRRLNFVHASVFGKKKEVSKMVIEASKKGYLSGLIATRIYGYPFLSLSSKYNSKTMKPDSKEKPSGFELEILKLHFLKACISDERYLVYKMLAVASNKGYLSDLTSASIDGISSFNLACEYGLSKTMVAFLSFDLYRQDGLEKFDVDEFILPFGDE